METIYDVAIIGGGINGCGCAADAALRGLSVILFEQDDLASKTSSSSTKLIHGGLRYLEHYEFKLVRKALKERQTLSNLAPHLIHEQAFVLPYEPHMRPSWLIRLGLFIYDHLSFQNTFSRAQIIHRNQQQSLFAPLKTSFEKGFIFYDGITEDSRLTIANAILAKEHNAQIKTRCLVTQIDIEKNYWKISYQSSNQSFMVRAKSLINAAGPWVKAVENLNTILDQSEKEISWIKGSHILVPKLYPEPHAYFLQNSDSRVVFVIPYHGFSLIGTTDIEIKPYDEVTITDIEKKYLIDSVNLYFAHHLKIDDIKYSWSGVRALIPELNVSPSALSRDYTINYNSSISPPVLSIYGGKITTFRNLAQEAIDLLKPQFPSMGLCTTSQVALPGYKMGTDFNFYKQNLFKKFSWLDENILQRYLKTYGNRTEHILHGCTNYLDLGLHFGAGLYEIEVIYLIHNEWAKTSEDILYRRTKLYLKMNSEEKIALANYVKNSIEI